MVKIKFVNANEFPVCGMWQQGWLRADLSEQRCFLIAFVPSGLLPWPKETGEQQKDSVLLLRGPPQFRRSADPLRDMEQRFKEAGWKLGHHQGSPGKRMEYR